MTATRSPSRGDIDARSCRGAAPVPGPAPAGMNVRDVPEFERLEAELRRMDAGGPTAVDWSKVSTLSFHILANQSKDILVACWAAYGLFRTKGYQGRPSGDGRGSERSIGSFAALPAEVGSTTTDLSLVDQVLAENIC
ncbi:MULTISPECIES: type VI secretion system ImpA family N-terminal domain-containing protein [Bradyrhizobium]|nr:MULTISPECIES: type VI secretion system ImpA family N-terminal domain-containing protein [Bradyrhizobium]